jgi:hypothetical protein
MSVIDPSLPWTTPIGSVPTDNKWQAEQARNGCMPGDLGIVDTLDVALELADELRGITYVATERG